MGKILTGSVIGQGVVLLASPLLTRLYTPSGFGTLAVVTSTSAMVGAVVTLGLERAVPLPRSHTGARALARSAVASLVAWSIVVAIVAYLERGALAERFSAPGLFDLWWTIPCGAAAIGGQRVVAALLIRHRAHGRIAQRNAVQGIVQVVSGVVLAPTGALGLVLAPTVGRLVASLGVGAGPRRRDGHGPVPLRVVRATLRRYRRFVWYTPGSALMNVAGQQLPWLVIAASQGVLVAGLVGLSVRVLATPVGVLAEAVAQSFAGLFAERLRAADRDLLPLVVRTSGRLLVPASCAAVVVVVAGPELFALVFGESWRAAGEFARVLVVVHALQLVTSPVSQVLPLLERQATQLGWDVGRTLLVTGGLLVAVVAGASTPVLLMTYVALAATAYAVLWVLVATAARHHDAAR
ncbi:lipopolysaccharide biosynthesis protein [Curtobacterium citreum]|uniref:lipopolysaccharide biosynthesis protein n=1 Tax=Curtobacterium citreum TaxID=2036 RepID=UPI002543A702|nr:oligosaccharide flippase family protein [Curtobacterium citreum]WIJ45834.1 oligosaccharide flippase family protein [Curtobacterium citreum]